MTYVAARGGHCEYGISSMRTLCARFQGGTPSAGRRVWCFSHGEVFGREQDEFRRRSSLAPFLPVEQHLASQSLQTLHRKSHCVNCSVGPGLVWGLVFSRGHAGLQSVVTAQILDRR